MTGYVYFIKPVCFEGPVKIGFSQNPDHRLAAIERFSPFPLEVVAKIAGDLVLERRFHAAFALHHRRHEWFDCPPALRAAIEEIKAGMFDAASLPPPQMVTRSPNSPQKGISRQPEPAPTPRENAA